MSEQVWWKEPMRVMQYNLQVKDTPGMDPVRLAEETKELESNVVVMNVGGIYAWYPSEVPFHHVNEYLPRGRDLLKELIDAFHEQGIRFVARFDFSIAEDTTYLKKPQWFARHKDKEPYFRGEKRMGEWSLFLNTCALGGYRNEEVAVPVMKEVLGRYDIDGIFLNAPHAGACFCERCQRKYQSMYGKSMPDTPEEFEYGWLSACMQENIGNIYRGIKETRQDVPLILYYAPFNSFSKSFGRCDRDSIYDRYETADLICTESQNVLSRGVGNLPDTIHPVLAMKSGQLPEREKLPFGIIHSCPGMDWRHVGMPTAEYLPWMSQVPASGGVLWHSVTGYPDTIPDKRILKAVGRVNHWTRKAEAQMQGAQYRSNVLLLWNGDPEARGWADALVKNHAQFDLMHDYDFRAERLAHYDTVIIPAGYPMSDTVADSAMRYAAEGGLVITEVTEANVLMQRPDLYGITEEVYESEYLLASYLRFEPAGLSLKQGMDTDRIPFRGKVCYCLPAEDGETMATLIPPFAPYEVVGAPPERASIPVSGTDIPLVIGRRCQDGVIITLPFSVSSLIREYHLADHYTLIRNLLGMAPKAELQPEITAPHDVQATIYEKENQVLVHFVNETGTRPLLNNLPVYGIEIKLPLKEGQKVVSVRSVIEENEVTCEIAESALHVHLQKVTIWDMVSIQLA